MNTNLQDTILKITDTAVEREDYTGEDGLLYCGKCHKPKEAYFPEGKTLFGRDRHPAECDCQREARKEREAAEHRRKHLAGPQGWKKIKNFLYLEYMSKASNWHQSCIIFASFVKKC